MTGSRIRVAVVIDGLGPGGAEALLSDFVVGARSADLDVSVAFLFRRDQEPAVDRLRAVGVEPVHVPATGLVSPSSVAALRRHLAERRPSIVHTHLGYADLLGGLAARSLGLPVVSTVHLADWSADSRRDARKLDLFARARRHLDARVIAVSAAARHVYLDHWDRPEHVTVVHNGVVDGAVPGSGRAVRAELGLAPAHVVIGMLSVLREGKGHDVAVEAARRLRSRFPDVRLLIVGDGPLAPAVARQAAGDDTVVLAGHRADAMAVLDAVDVLVHPSVQEAFPTALLEAAAAAVPVVATRVGGIPEIVDDGVTGVLVDAPTTPGALAGALAPLVADAATRARLAQAARARYLDAFTATCWAVRTRRLYEAVGARPSVPAGGATTRSGAAPPASPPRRPRPWPSR